MPTRKLVQAKASVVAAVRTAAKESIPNIIRFILLCYFTALNDISNPFTECVSAPTEMKSTPHSA